MTVQIRKTYRGISPEMLSAEIQGSVQKQGISVGKTDAQTYSILSGATQTRIAAALKTHGKRTEDIKDCGSIQILSLPGGEIQLLLDLNETVIPKENISVLQGDINFTLDPYEVKW